MLVDSLLLWLGVGGWGPHLAFADHNGTPAITQVGSTSVIVTGSEFVSNHGPKTTHLALDPQGKGGKVIFTENIIKGVLKVDNPGNNKKVIVTNNLDDS